MQKLVGEADLREGDPSPGGGYSVPPIPTLHPRSCLPLAGSQPAEHPEVLDVSPEPHVVKDAKLWPTLRQFSQKVTENTSQLSA